MPNRPGGTHWVETDRYDRARLAELRKNIPAFGELDKSGSVLFPHFGSLLDDLFASLYKENVLFLPEAEIAPSAGRNRTLLRGLLASTPWNHLSERTRLDETRAGLGTLLLAEKALEALRAEVLFPRSELLDPFDLARDEQELHERLDQIDSADEISEEGVTDLFVRV